MRTASSILLIFLLLVDESSRAAFASETLAKRYQALLTEYPADGSLVERCAPTNFTTRTALYHYRTNVRESNPSRDRPNFSGKYLLLENPMTGGSTWFVVDCLTGKYLGKFPVVGDLIFSTTSRAVVTKRFNDDDTSESFVETGYGLPLVYEWKNGRFRKRKNPVQPASGIHAK
jgi:hypothetical protein